MKIGQMAIRSVVVAIYTRFPFPRLANTPALLHTDHAGVCLCLARATKEPVFVAQDFMLRPCWTAERKTLSLAYWLLLTVGFRHVCLRFACGDSPTVWNDEC